MCVSHVETLDNVISTYLLGDSFTVFELILNLRLQNPEVDPISRQDIHGRQVTNSIDFTQLYART